MLFSSLIFLQWFLPFALLCYYGTYPLFPNRPKARRSLQNLILFLFSMAFYAFGGIKYLLLMLGVILLNFVGGLFIGASEDPGQKKTRMVLTVAGNLLILFYFKYFNLFVAAIENLFFYAPENGSRLAALLSAKGNGALGLTQVVLPIGISFYIFQAISYVIDVTRGEARVQKHFLNFALYISFFPQLIAGPIVQYTDIAKQIRGRKENERRFADGVRRFIYGLAKKVLIANTMAEIADEIWALKLTEIGAGIAWLGLAAYTLQIYFDFSGYSDMAIGLGKLFGFRFKDNFNYPYLATSIQDFWRRWHISLSSWFRNYVYIPLGGSRCSKGKLYRNIFVVFLLTGIWHGANWTFLIWGLIYALLLILERAWLGEKLKRNSVKVLNHLYVLSVVMLAWVFFRSDSVADAGIFIGQLFCRATGDYSVLSFLSMRRILTFLVGVLLSGSLQALLSSTYEKARKQPLVAYLEIAYQILLLLACMLILANGSYNPFIYFQF